LLSEIEDLDDVLYLTSDLLSEGEPAELDKLPESLVILGGRLHRT